MDTWRQILALAAIQEIAPACVHERVLSAAEEGTSQASAVKASAAELEGLEQPQMFAVLERTLVELDVPKPLPAPVIQLADGSWLLGETEFTWQGLSGHARFLELPGTILAELRFTNASNRTLWWPEIARSSARRPSSYDISGRTKDQTQLEWGGGTVGSRCYGNSSPRETSRDQRQAWEFLPGATHLMRVSVEPPLEIIGSGLEPSCISLHFRLLLDPPVSEVPLLTEGKQRAIQLIWELGQEARVEWAVTLWGR